MTTYIKLKNFIEKFVLEGLNLISEVQHDSRENIDNLKLTFVSDTKNSEQKENDMYLIKNMRIRNDGRYEWRKTIAGTPYAFIDNCIKRLKEKVQQFNKNILATTTKVLEKPRTSKKLIDIAWEYHKRYRVGKIKDSSAARHEYVLKGDMSVLTQDIANYTKNDIQDFLNNVQGHRNAVYCYLNLKNAFAEALDTGLIKKNILTTLKKPPNKTQKGSWIKLADQAKILSKCKGSILGKEILFYLMTGCRRGEAFSAKVNFEKCTATITRQKTQQSGYATTNIPLSKEFCKIIQCDWDKMFATSQESLGKRITEFLKELDIKDKSAHDLRHTFSTNLYYLGVDAKLHQYLMGHKSIQMTYDVYTTFDPSVTKKDILYIYSNLYPQF